MKAGSEAPPVFHCSAGVGRTGVFAAVVAIHAALRLPLRPLEVVANEDFDHEVRCHALISCDIFKKHVG
jgi:protein tyrosine phosphatase